MLGGLSLPFVATAPMPLLALRAPCVRVVLIRVSRPPEADWLSGNEALRNVLADKCLGLGSMLIALYDSAIAQAAAQPLSHRASGGGSATGVVSSSALEGTRFASSSGLGLAVGGKLPESSGRVNCDTEPVV